MRKRRTRSHRNLRPANPEAAVIAQLRRRGADLSEMRRIDFYLYFPSREKAEIAGTKLAAEGFVAHIERAALGSDWLCLASKEMLPAIAELVMMRKTFSDFAGELGGKYDGFETEVRNDDAWDSG